MQWENLRLGGEILSPLLHIQYIQQTEASPFVPVCFRSFAVSFIKSDFQLCAILNP